jgi:hypothetical protein
MTRMHLAAIFVALLLVLNTSIVLHAEDGALDDIKAKILDAKVAQQTFSGGLRHCAELNGSNFYFQARDRVLNLDDYHRSLNSLALQGVFNPETKRPWNQQDADARWEEVKKLAVSDRTKCALVASLPDLEKKLDELQKQSASSQDKN